MMKKNFYTKMNSIRPILFICIGFFISTHSLASSKIQKLTSSKNTQRPAQKIPATSVADNSKRLHSIGLGVGQTFLHGDFNDYGDDKITWDLLYNYTASHSFDFMANLHMSEHSKVKLKTKLSGISMGIKAKLYQIDAFSPYVLGGLGFYKPRLVRNIKGTLTETKSKVTFGVHAGAGAELKLNKRVAIGVLGHYHNPFDVQQEDQADEVEGSYFKLLITGLYFF